MVDYMERLKQQREASEAKDREEQRLVDERKDRSFEKTLKKFADEKIGSKPFWIAMVASLLLLVLFLVLAFTVNGNFAWGILSIIVVYVTYKIWYSKRREKMIEEVKETIRTDETFKAKFIDSRNTLDEKMRVEDSKTASESAIRSREYDQARDRRTAEVNSLKYSAYRPR